MRGPRPEGIASLDTRKIRADARVMRGELPVSYLRNCPDLAGYLGHHTQFHREKSKVSPELISHEAMSKTDNGSEDTQSPLPHLGAVPANPRRQEKPALLNPIAKKGLLDPEFTANQSPAQFLVSAVRRAVLAHPQAHRTRQNPSASPTLRLPIYRHSWSGHTGQHGPGHTVGGCAGGPATRIRIPGGIPPFCPSSRRMRKLLRQRELMKQRCLSCSSAFHLPNNTCRGYTGREICLGTPYSIPSQKKWCPRNSWAQGKAWRLFISSHA